MRAQDGTNPLCVAAYNGHPDIVLMLLAAGADKTMANKKGQRPIDYTCQSAAAKQANRAAIERMLRCR